MANTLGGLVVTLGLNAVEFTTGLTKSEYQARRFAQRLDKEIAKGIIKAQVAIEAFGRAARTAFDKAITDVGNFKQISEQIGETAQNVAALDKAAATSGVSLQEVGGITAKLAATLSQTDEEGDKAAQALKALGLNVQDFKALSPVAQLEELARAMAQFGDSSGKTAVAIALLGKSGAQALPFLNDLADQGGRTVQLTQEQIETIDRYSKSVAAFGQEIATAGRILASDFIGWLQKMQAEMRAGIDIAGSFLGALRLFGTIDISPLKSLEEKLGDVNARIREANELANQGGFLKFLSNLGGGFAERAINDLEKQRKFLLFQIGQQALANSSSKDFDARDLKARQRPFLDFQITKPGGGGRSGGSAQISEAERYLESLAKQIERTKELSAVELARAEIARFKKAATPDEERRIFALAAELDLQRAIKEQEEERKRVEQEAARAREQASRLEDKIIDDKFKSAEALRQENERIKENIVFLTGGEEALRAMERARVASNIALEEENLLMAQNASANPLQIAAINATIAALKQRQALLAEVDIAEKMRIEVEKLQDLKDSFSDALVQPLVDFVNQTKSAKDAFKSFIKSIEQMLTQKAARGVADWLFGGNTQSGFDFGTIFKLFGGMFGGGSSFMNVIDTVPPIFGGFAHGTSFAPGGRAWVGEQGPELVDLPRGARVIPNKAAMSLGGQSMVFNVNVMPGADTRSAKQVGGVLRDTVIRAIKDR